MKKRLFAVLLILISAAVFYSLKYYRFLVACLLIAALIETIFYTLSFFPKMKHLKYVLYSLIAIGSAAIIAVEIPIVSTSVKKEVPESKYVIVLGCGVHGTAPSLMLRKRIDAAYEFLMLYPETKAILSGGQGDGEDISEAECMYRELLKKGIDESRLYKEDKSTTTEENIAFSKQYFEASETKVAIISSKTHLYRASLIAKKEGLSPTVYAAEVPKPVMRFSQYLREAVAVWYFILFK